MTRVRNLAFASAMLVAGLVAVQPQRAHATTMVATVCTIAFNPCPVFPVNDVLDAGIRSNGVGVLGANRYAVLPFSFNDAFTSVTGTVVVADFAAKFIYLVGFGQATSTIGPVDIDIAISQNYRTTPGTWTFGGFNIGSCIGVATGDGDGVTSLPVVNGVGIGGPAGAACSPFAQFFGPQSQKVGGITNMTATAIFGFNGPGPQVIGLPWGTDFPSPALTINDTTTLSSLLGDLKDDGLTLSVPEPSTWAMMLLGAGLMGAGLRIRRRKSATMAAAV